MKTKRSELGELQKKIAVLYSLRGNEKFRYAVDKNLEKLNSLNHAIGQSIQTMYQKLKGADAFRKEYQAEYKKHLKMDGEHFLLIDDQPVVKDQEKWAAVEAIINEKHSAFLEASKKVEQQVEKYIAEEVTVDLHPLERENWPELRSLEDEDIIKTYLTQKLIN